MKKIISILSIALFSNAFAQEQSEIEGKRWVYGGGIGLNINNGLKSNGNAFSLMIAPKVGYLINNHFEVGVNGNYTWYNSSYTRTNMLGIGPYATYYYHRSYYGTVLFQQYFINEKYKSARTENFNTSESALYIGGGYIQQVGNHSYMQLGLMYNVLKNNPSVLGGALIPNVGLIIGI